MSTEVVTEPTPPGTGVIAPTLRIFPAGHMLFAVCHFQFKAKLLFSLTHRNSAVMAAVSDFLLMDNVFHTVDASDEIF